MLEADPQPRAGHAGQATQDARSTPLGDSSQRQEAELRKFVGLPEMKVKLSKHFLLLHDTPDTLTRGKLTRADERLQLLETVYECFLLRFYAYGVELEIPKERLQGRAVQRARASSSCSPSG